MTQQLRFPIVPQGTVSPAAAEAAKQDGIARATANTPPDWATACRAAIELMARRGIPFQAASDLRDVLRAGRIPHDLMTDAELEQHGTREETGR